MEKGHKRSAQLAQGLKSCKQGIRTMKKSLVNLLRKRSFFRRHVLIPVVFFRTSSQYFLQEQFAHIEQWQEKGYRVTIVTTRLDIDNLNYLINRFFSAKRQGRQILPKQRLLTAEGKNILHCLAQSSIHLIA